MTNLSHPWWRASGVVVTAVCIFFLDTQNPSVKHQLLIPLTLALAAYLMTQAPLAVAFAGLSLATIHGDLSATSWIQAQAYPFIALLSLAVCIVLTSIRFKARIAQTHAARWQSRHAGDDDDAKRGH